MIIYHTAIIMLSYSSLGQQSIFYAFTGWISFLEKRMSSSEIPHLKHCRPARNTAATLPLLQFHTHLCVLLHTYVYWLIWRCSKWSIPDIQKNLRMCALREFHCKGSSWLLLIPWFCNTYNTYIWGGHNEYIVPFPMFKHYFIWILDVVITVCILVQSPRSKFKQ